MPADGRIGTVREPVVSSVVVVGAGVSGLTVAFELLERSERLGGNVRILCLEASDRAGGNIRTDRDRGFSCEAGPTGFLDSAPATVTLVRRLGLGERVVRVPDAAATRFVYRAGALRPIPTGPGAFLGSGVLSFRGKMRVLAEPLVSRSTEPDESVFSFASRRIGAEAASVLVDAMVNGVYAGNPRELSLVSTFPKMRAMEQEHGSLFRALLARRRKARPEGTKAGGPAGPGGTLTSFQDGLEELISALAERLGDRLRLRSRVQQVADMGRRGFRILLDEGAPLEAEAVVLACPAWSAAPIVEAMDPALAGVLRDIPSAPVVVVHTGFSRMAFAEVPAGFGFLVPRGQGARILGTLWISNLFPGRSPEGAVLFTTMIGGAQDTGVVELTDADLMRIVREDLKSTMGVTVAPFFSRIVRWPRGIPQYTLGHPDRLAAIDQALARHPGLFVSGNSYRGISVNACVEEAPAVAEAILAHAETRARA